MYSSGKLFMRSREGYFGVYFPSCAATREINTKITLELLMLLTRGALLFFNVIHQISRSHRWYKSSILTQIGRFRTVTPVSIHQWLWNDAQSLKQHRRGALLFIQGHPSIVKVTQDKKSQILTQIERFRTVTPVWIYQWLWNAAKKLNVV